MGNNVAGGLGGAYQPGKQLDLRNSHWQMHEATKRDDKGGSSEVTIFKFLKAQTDRAAAAQRGMQKLRTMKHPYVLGFVDSNAEDKESLLLVTEACVPLSVWLEDTLKEGRGRSNSSSSNNSKINIDNSSSEGPSLLNQALWGFRCVVNALDFLHTKCSIGHNSLSTNSIFVMRNGDWKIGCLDFAANPSSERLFLRDSTGFIPRECIPPEVQSGGWGDAFKDADVYALGRVLTTVLESIGDSGGGKVSDALRRSIQRMVSPDPEKRPNSTQILKYPDFNSESIKILADLDDFSLKTPQEVLDVLRKVAGKSKEFPRQICANKITPIVMDRLKIASIDFQNREMREYCRNSIDVCVEILALFVEGEKINEATLSPQASDILSQVWTMPDRTVRTCLLRTCKNMIVLFPAAVVNKSLFQPVLAGFSDSNPKMREETLKNLIHFVEKLDETNLQERLVRQIKLLQDDNEKSIRTNAVIFLSRIAPKLSAVTRSKVLSPCLVKAMRDGFVPCRSAGLKATQACAQLMDPMQLITTVLPQVCLLMVDPSGDVRTLALALMESTLKVVHGLHTAMNEQEMKARDMMMQNRSGGHGNMSGGGSGGSMGGDDSPNSPALKAQQQGTASSWGSWAVGEITKTIEKVAISETTNPNYNNNDIKSHIGELKSSFSSSAISSSSSSSATSSVSGGSNIGGINIPVRGNSNTLNNSNTNSIKSAVGTLSMAKSSSADSGMTSSSSRAAQEPKPKAKPLSLDNDDDDDFDDFGTGKGGSSSNSNSGKGASPSGWEKDDDINWSDDDADGVKGRDKGGSGKDRYRNSDSDRDGGGSDDDDDDSGYATKSAPAPAQIKMPAHTTLKVPSQAVSSWNDEEDMMAGASSSSALKPVASSSSSSSSLSSSTKPASNTSNSGKLGLDIGSSSSFSSSLSSSSSTGSGLKTQVSHANTPVAPAGALLGHISSPSPPQSSSSSSSSTSTAFYFKNDSASSSTGTTPSPSSSMTLSAASSTTSSSSSAPKAPIASRYNLNPAVGGAASRYGITKPPATATTSTTSNTTSTTTNATSQPAGSK